MALDVFWWHVFSYYGSYTHSWCYKSYKNVGEIELWQFFCTYIAEVGWPITCFINKKKKFFWWLECDHIFKYMKERLASILIPKNMNWKCSFILNPPIQHYVGHMHYYKTMKTRGFIPFTMASALYQNPTVDIEAA